MEPNSPNQNPAPNPSTSPVPPDASPAPVPQPGQVVGGGTQPPQPVGFSPNVTPPPVNGPAPAAVVTPGQQPGMPPTQPAAKRPLKKILLAVLVILIVLVGASAAVYAAVIVPNKPENVLKKALINSVKQPQVRYAGQVTVDPVDGQDFGFAGKADFTGATDTAKKAAQINLKLTISGVNVDAEARLVGQNLYVKAGDLSTVTGLAGSLSPELAAPAQSVAQQLSNKWIVIDSTLLKQAGASCYLNSTWSLTDADITLLTKQYGEHSFATINSVSNDTVDGKKVKKFDISLDDDKMAAYADNLGNVSVIKTLQGCQKGKSKTQTTKSLADHDHTPITIWVDKSAKRVVRLSGHSTAQDAKKSNTKDTVTINLNYGNVSIQAPSNAEPAVKVLTELQQSFQGTGIDPAAGLLDTSAASTN